MLAHVRRGCRGAPGVLVGREEPTTSPSATPGQSPPTPTADQAVFRDVIGHFASGVTVITARHDAVDYGMTASAVSSLSLEPPMLLVCVNRATVTEAAIAGSGAFGVNILHEDQGEVAERFAGRHTPEKFAGVATTRGASGSPLLQDALACIECRVHEHVTGGTHTVFMGLVHHAESRPGAPLTYFRGSFGRFEQARDRAAYEELRDRVMDRRLARGRPLSTEALADELGVERAAVYHALTKLHTEGLITRHPRKGYVVTPMTVRVSDEIFDARCAVEVGVAEATVGRTSGEQLATLRALMEATLPLIRDDRFVDIDAFAAANEHFHAFHVSLAGSTPLSEAYARLTNLGLIARTLTPGDRASSQLVEDHRRLVEGYETASLDAVRRVVREHAERAKETHRRAIEAAGGEI
ncbi:MAG: 4-nitrophenol 2-monooxygenase / 4-nitrocatechol 4-monooxygenase, reductase component [Solirubrobacteraceae bacterium]|nr:4-nitrophenol 2-monooxygenase / 4-nitrocatechol 4-monooxygenase, reductase component [Solirubrobacteraceae bacterium]